MSNFYQKAAVTGVSLVGAWFFANIALDNYDLRNDAEDCAEKLSQQIKETGKIPTDTLICDGDIQDTPSSLFITSVTILPSSGLTCTDLNVEFNSDKTPLKRDKITVCHPSEKNDTGIKLPTLGFDQ